MFCSILTGVRLAAGVLCSRWNRWLFSEPLISCQRPWAEQAGCSALKRLPDELWLCRECRRLNNPPNVTDRGSSCVLCVISKRLPMMRRASDSVSMATVGEARWRLKTWRLKLTLVGVEREIGSFNQPTFAHFSVNSIHRCPKVHRTIKKLSNYQIPPRGGLKPQCQEIKQQVSKKPWPDPTLWKEGHLLCVNVRAYGVFLSTWLRLATCLRCNSHFLSELGPTWCSLEQTTLWQKMYTYIQIECMNIILTTCEEKYFLRKAENTVSCINNFQHILLFVFSRFGSSPCANVQ